MHAYFFANYRLLTDEGIANHESIKRQLAEFETPMPYTHTFTLRLGDTDELEEKRAWALGYPVAYRVGSATLHDMDDGWAFVSRQRWGGTAECRAVQPGLGRHRRLADGQYI